MTRSNRSTRERLVFHVQELERVEDLKQQAAECVKESYAAAAADGFDKETLKVVLKLRKMTPEQRRDRRALVDVYMASLGMLDGEALSDEARRRFDPPPSPPKPDERPDDDQQDDEAPEAAAPDVAPAVAPSAPQRTLVLKTPAEARQEGMDAAAAGKRVYDNPYPAGDPCRAAWDEGWCAQSNSHGMDTPSAYQRRAGKPPEKDQKPDGTDGNAGPANPDQEAA